MKETILTAEQMKAAAEVIDELTDKIIDPNASKNEKVRYLCQLHGAEKMLNALGFDHNADKQGKSFIYRVED